MDCLQSAAHWTHFIASHQFHLNLCINCCYQFTAGVAQATETLEINLGFSNYVFVFVYITIFMSQPFDWLTFSVEQCKCAVWGVSRADQRDRVFWFLIHEQQQNFGATWFIVYLYIRTPHHSAFQGWNLHICHAMVKSFVRKFMIELFCFLQFFFRNFRAEWCVPCGAEYRCRSFHAVVAPPSHINSYPSRSFAFKGHLHVRYSCPFHVCYTRTSYIDCLYSIPVAPNYVPNEKQPLQPIYGGCTVL